MDTDAMVRRRAEEGRELLLRLTEAGFDVAASCWVQRAEDGRWVLLIVTPVVDRRGSVGAYKELLQVFHSWEQQNLASDDIVLVGETHPRAGEILRLRGQYSGFLNERVKPSTLFGIPVREVYIYPTPLRRKLSDTQKQLLVDLYAKVRVPVDALPYTDEMNQLHRDFVRQSGCEFSVGDLFRTLMNLRKQSLLPAITELPDSANSNSAPSAEAV